VNHEKSEENKPTTKGSNKILYNDASSWKKYFSDDGLTSITKAALTSSREDFHRWVDNMKSWNLEVKTAAKAGWDAIQMEHKQN
jgi:hypothetical protein